VLCIDDKRDVLAVLAEVLQNSGYSALTAASGTEGLRLLRSTAVHVVVLDYEMPEVNGDLIAQAIRRYKPEVPIVLFTGAPDDVSDGVRAERQSCCSQDRFQRLAGRFEEASRRICKQAKPDLIRCQLDGTPRHRSPLSSRSLHATSEDHERIWRSSRV